MALLFDNSPSGLLSGYRMEVVRASRRSSVRAFATDGGRTHALGSRSRPARSPIYVASVVLPRSPWIPI
jgi:hypothetical protein